MGPKYDYYPKPSKFHLTIKEEHLDRAKFIFKRSEVKITKNGQRHFGVVIGSKEFTQEYIESMVNNCNDQFIYLSKTGEMEPRAAYAAFIGGFKSNVYIFSSNSSRYS